MTPVYALPREVNDISDCYFYHTVELPGYGVVRGQWDLRGSVDAYLGDIELRGKRVLEIGTASGFLCFEMEKRGAEVVAFDLCEDELWDTVPYDGEVSVEAVRRFKNGIRRVNNSWWFIHKLYASNARVVYGNVYHIPEEIGTFHITTFGSVLLHLRDPFLALQNAAKLTTETIVVTEVLPVFQRYSWFYSIWKLLGKLDRRFARYFIPALDFLPDPDRRQPLDTWWNFSPELICRFLKMLGFPHQRVSYHTQKHNYGADLSKTRRRRMYTVVGERNRTNAEWA